MVYSTNQLPTNTMSIQFSVTKVTANRWLATINGQEFDYFTGSLVTKKPSLDDVLKSLLIDSSACNYNFQTWCEEFGYTPSSDTETIYRVCLDDANKLQKTGIDLQAEKLRLQDY